MLGSELLSDAADDLDGLGALVEAVEQTRALDSKITLLGRGFDDRGQPVEEGLEAGVVAGGSPSLGEGAEGFFVVARFEDPLPGLRRGVRISDTVAQGPSDAAVELGARRRVLFDLGSLPEHHDQILVALRTVVDPAEGVEHRRVARGGVQRLLVVVRRSLEVAEALIDDVRDPREHFGALVPVEDLRAVRERLHETGLVARLLVDAFHAVESTEVRRVLVEQAGRGVKGAVEILGLFLEGGGEELEHLDAIVAIRRCLDALLEEGEGGGEVALFEERVTETGCGLRIVGTQLSDVVERRDGGLEILPFVAVDGDQLPEDFDLLVEIRRRDVALLEDLHELVPALAGLQEPGELARSVGVGRRDRPEEPPGVEGAFDVAQLVLGEGRGFLEAYDLRIFRRAGGLREGEGQIAER